MAATVAPARARASRPAVRERVEQQSHPVRARHADERVLLDPVDHGAQLALHGPRLDPDRRRLDHLRAQLAQARRQAARLRPRARDGNHLAMQRARLQPGDRLAQLRDAPDDRDRRGPHTLGLHARRDPAQGVDDRPLARMRAALDHRHRLPGVSPGSGQALGDQRQVLDPHVEDERAGEARQGVPVERRAGLGGVLVTRDERHRRGRVPVRHGNPRVRRRRHTGGHAGNDLEGHAGRGQRLGLLAAAPEHEGVAALQPHHPLAGPGQLDEQPVRLLLRQRRRARLLADVAELGVGPRALERALRDEAVVEDRVRRGDQLERPARHQARVAGTRAHQVDDAAHAENATCAGWSARSGDALRLGQQLARAGREHPRSDGVAESGRLRAQRRLLPVADPAAIRPAGRRRRHGAQFVRHPLSRGRRPACGTLRRGALTRARSAVRQRERVAVGDGSGRLRGLRAAGAGLQHEGALARGRHEDAGVERSSSSPRRSRSRPACASTIASNSPSARRRSRVSTLPRRSRTSRSGRRASSGRAAAKAGRADHRAVREVARARLRRTARPARPRAPARRRSRARPAARPARPSPSAPPGRSPRRAAPPRSPSRSGTCRQARASRGGARRPRS